MSARGSRCCSAREDDIEPVGEAGSGREAIFEARSLKPDVILMDVVMPDRTGSRSIPTLLREQPETKILVLSMQDDPRYVREAFAAGASGYVLKEAADVEVVAAVREVARGGRYVHPELGARLIAADAEAAAKAEEDPLSDREREVLRLLALGHTNQEIAKQLFISVRTAETHRAHIMQKLRLSSRAELVRYALAHGLLEHSDSRGPLARPSRSRSCGVELRRSARPSRRRALLCFGRASAPSRGSGARRRSPGSRSRSRRAGARLRRRSRRARAARPCSSC